MGLSRKALQVFNTTGSMAWPAAMTRPMMAVCA
jgi:hypothetical protein